MKETLLIITLIILIYIFLFYNNNKLVYIENSDFGTRFLVQNNEDKFKSSKILSKLTQNLYKLRNHLVKNINDYPNYKQYIKLLKTGFNNNRTTIHEGLPDSNLTSYSVNKGEELVFCVRIKKEGDKLMDVNPMTFVALHELSHLMTKSVGHTQEFWDNFKIILQISIHIGVYKHIDFQRNPEPYCGIEINDTPYKPGN